MSLQSGYFVAKGAYFEVTVCRRKRYKHKGVKMADASI